MVGTTWRDVLTLAVFLLVLTLAGCLEARLEPCGDLLCPDNTTCVANELCAAPAQIAACDGIADGGSCSVAGSAGRCDRGVCFAAGCGNQVVDPGETCDDGNEMSGDGCRADCRKIEMCGDGIVDDGEACDDGNNNSADGCDLCTATTWVATSLLGGSLSAVSVGLSYPWEVTLDGQGNLYIADVGNARVRRVAADTGIMTTVAGTGSYGYSGDGGPATNAELAAPYGVDVDGLGNIFIADTINHRVRRVDATTGVITTVAGTGVAGGAGDLFVADTGNNRVRRVAADTKLITTVLGDGVAGSSGTGRPAMNFSVNAPRGLACDAANNLFVTSTTTVRFLPADIEVGATSGVVDGSGAVQTTFGLPPRDTFPASVSGCLTGIAVVDADTVQVTDSCAGLLVELSRQAVL